MDDRTGRYASAAPGPAPAYHVPPPHRYGGAHAYPAPTPQSYARRTSTSAIVALVCGILGITTLPLVLSIVALVFASKADEEIAADPGLEGAALAKAGRILGYVGIVIGVFTALMWLFMLFAFGGFAPFPFR